MEATERFRPSTVVAALKAVICCSSVRARNAKAWWRGGSKRNDDSPLAGTKSSHVSYGRRFRRVQAAVTVLAEEGELASNTRILIKNARR